MHNGVVYASWHAFPTSAGPIVVLFFYEWLYKGLYGPYKVLEGRFKAH